MTHDWLVTHKHPSGSIKEPDGIVCTKCGLDAMRWCGSFIIKTTDVVKGLCGAYGRPADGSKIPRVSATCAGGGNAG
jgi:hypothetical protein